MDNSVDYMNINLRPDLNPMYVEENCDGEKLTPEESLFIHYMVAGLSRVEAFIKAGFVLPRTQVGERQREKDSSNDRAIEKALLSTDIEEPLLEKEELPAEAGEEKRGEYSVLVKDRIYKPITLNTPINTLADIQKLPLEQRLLILRSSNDLCRNPAINREYTIRLRAIEQAGVADSVEIYTYLTAVMRGQVKDQFGLEASLQERTRAAEALAKRIIDMPAKLAAATAWAEQGAVTINIQPRKEVVIDVTDSTQ